MAAALPLSTAATNVFAAMAFFAWVLSGTVLVQVRRAARDPVVFGAVAATLLVLAGMLWSSAELTASAEAAGKYRKLILLAMLVVLLDEPRWRVAVLAVFFGSTVLLLLASIGIYLRLPGLPALDQFQGAILCWSHITQGLLMALLAAAALIWSSKPHALWLKLMAWVVAAAALSECVRHDSRTDRLSRGGGACVLGKLAVFQMARSGCGDCCACDVGVHRLCQLEPSQASA